MQGDNNQRGHEARPASDDPYAYDDPYAHDDSQASDDSRASDAPGLVSPASTATEVPNPGDGEREGPPRRKLWLALSALLVAVIALASDLTIGALVRWAGDGHQLLPFAVGSGILVVLLAVAAMMKRQVRWMSIVAIVVVALVVVPAVGRAVTEAVRDARVEAEEAAAPGGSANPIALGETVTVGKWTVRIDLVNFDASDWAEETGSSLADSTAGRRLVVVSGVFTPWQEVSMIGDPLPQLTIEDTAGKSTSLLKERSIIPDHPVVGGKPYKVGVPVRWHWAAQVPQELLDGAEGPTLQLRAEREFEPDRDFEDWYESKYVSLGTADELPEWVNSPQPTATNAPSPAPTMGGETQPWHVGDSFEVDDWIVTVESVAPADDGGTLVSLTVMNGSDRSRIATGTVEPSFAYSSDWGPSGPRSGLRMPAPDPAFPLVAPVEAGATATGYIHFSAAALDGWALIFGNEGSTPAQYVVAA